MAQRRSKNRRSSTRRSNNFPDQFNENTNIINNDDPLWFDRTIIRPSTSFMLSKHDNSLLNSDSTDNAPELSDKWYMNLSESQNYKNVMEAARKKINEPSEKQSITDDENTESESDYEFKKKRSKFSTKTFKKNESNKKNAFTSALEKMNDSHAQSITNIQQSQTDESESTIDESKTIKKLRPNIFKSKKSNDKSINFAEILTSDTGSGKDSSNQNKSLKRNSNRLKNKSLNDSKKDNSESNSTNQSHISNNITLRNKKIIENTNNITKSPKIVSDYVIKNKIRIGNLEKKRPTLFSHEDEVNTRENLFDAILEENSSHNINENVQIETNKNKVSQKNLNTSKNSSITKNIRTTRSNSNSITGQNDKSELNLQNTSAHSLTNKSKSISESSVNFEDLNLEDDDESFNNNMSKENVQIETNKNKVSQKNLNTSKNSSITKNIRTTRSNSNLITEQNDKSELNLQESQNNRMITDDNDTSSLPKYIRRTKSQVRNVSTSFSNFNNVNTKKLQTAESDNIEISGSSRVMSENNASNLVDPINKETHDITKNSVISGKRLSIETTSEKSHHRTLTANRKSLLIEEANQSRNRTIPEEASGIFTEPQVSLNKNREMTEIKLTSKGPITSKISRKSNTTSEKETSEEYFSDDVIKTPHPAQSTLNVNGRPFTRLTEFRGFEADNSSPDNFQSATAQGIEKFIKSKNLSPNKKDQQSSSKSISWDIVKKKVDLIKKTALANIEREKNYDQENKQKQERTEQIFKRTMALKQAELKRKNKKPIDKAYFVKGKLYKQPKLMRPKSWATDKLYKYLWKCMESSYGIKTRIESENFVHKLAEISTLVIKKKKYEQYSRDLDNLLVIMAKLKIIDTRYDFYRFCSEFMPYNFRIKVIPMKLPGNTQNIPFDRKLLNTPILSNVEENSNRKNRSSYEPQS